MIFHSVFYRLLNDQQERKSVITSKLQLKIFFLKENIKQIKQKMKTLIVLVLTIFVVFATFTITEAGGFKKPPFNGKYFLVRDSVKMKQEKIQFLSQYTGSIFGKRGNTMEYESGAQRLQAMCEIASEACQQWFSPDK